LQSPVSPLSHVFQHRGPNCAPQLSAPPCQKSVSAVLPPKFPCNANFRFSPHPPFGLCPATAPAFKLQFLHLLFTNASVQGLLPTVAGPPSPPRNRIHSSCLARALVVHPFPSSYPSLESLTIFSSTNLCLVFDVFLSPPALSPLSWYRTPAPVCPRPTSRLYQDRFLHSQKLPLAHTLASFDLASPLPLSCYAYPSNLCRRVRPLMVTFFCFSLRSPPGNLFFH